MGEPRASAWHQRSTDTSRATRLGKALHPSRAFTQLRPDSGAPASERTEVYFGFTDDTLHVGVVRHETAPVTITVSNEAPQPDSFTMVLDTFGTGRAGMAFGTNPVGADTTARSRASSSTGTGARSGKSVREPTTPSSP